MQLVSIDSDVFLYPQDEQTATVIKRFKANYNDKAVFEAVLLRTSKPQPSKRCMPGRVVPGIKRLRDAHVLLFTNDELH